MRVLVTGGAGYIGSVVAAQLVAAGHDVTVLDDLSTGFADAVPPGATFVKGTLRDCAAEIFEQSLVNIDDCCRFPEPANIVHGGGNEIGRNVGAE